MNVPAIFEQDPCGIPSDRAPSWQDPGSALGDRAPCRNDADDTCVAEAAMDGFCLVDHRDRILKVNDELCRIYGYSRSELVNLSISALEAVGAPAGESADFARIRQRGAERFETQHRRKDGAIIDVRISARIHPENPNLAMTFVRDISDRQRVPEGAACSSDLLVSLARLVPGVIYQYRLYPDGHSAFPYSSPGIELIYEVTPDEVQTDATAVFGRLHPEDYTMVANAIEASARTLETFYCEFRVLLPRQGLRWRWSQAQPQRMPDGGTLWHGIILDIHERKTAQLEKAALELQLQQAQKMESVGRLAGGVAHDFNNMLGVILGNAEIALDGVAAADPLRQDLEEIQKAALRSAELTRQLLAFARRQAIAPKVLNLGHTVAGLLTMLERLIGETIHIEWHADPDLWLVRMDSSQIDQVLANLCINARDSMSGGGKLEITLRNVSVDTARGVTCPGAEPGDYVRLSVRDTGSGMDPQTQAHLFEPFFTTKAIGKGTGLGLATVYGIVKQNGGFIGVESAVDHGTTMSVHIPRFVGSEVSEGMTRPVGVLQRGRETILLVEDEPAMLTMTASLLETLGYSVIAVGAAEDALRVAAERADEIRLLLTDVVMPDMNGKDLATILVARCPKLVVVFMSGYTAEAIATHGVLDDGVLFIQKPFTKEALAFKVSEALGTLPTAPIA